MTPTAPSSSNRVPTVVATPSGPYRVSDRMPTHSPTGTRCTCTVRSVLRNVYRVMSMRLPIPLAQSAIENNRCIGVIASPLTRSTIGRIHDSPAPGAIGLVSHSHSVLCT